MSTADAIGVHGLSRLDDGTVRVLVTEREVGAAGEPTLRDLSEALTAVYGSDYGVQNPTSLSRFTDPAGSVVPQKGGCCSPATPRMSIRRTAGQAQTGVQDAVNLGWKLAQVVRKTAPESLLDSYQAERRPVAAQVLRNTMSSVVLRHEDAATKALRGTVSELLAMEVSCASVSPA